MTLQQALNPQEMKIGRPHPVPTPGVAEIAVQNLLQLCTFRRAPRPAGGKEGRKEGGKDRWIPTRQWLQPPDAAAASLAAALYKQLSTLAGFVSQSSVTRTGQAREGGKEKETWTDQEQ